MWANWSIYKHVHGKLLESSVPKPWATNLCLSKFQCPKSSIVLELSCSCPLLHRKLPHRVRQDHKLRLLVIHLRYKLHAHSLKKVLSIYPDLCACSVDPGETSSRTTTNRIQVIFSSGLNQNNGSSHYQSSAGSYQASHWSFASIMVFTFGSGFWNFSRFFKSIWMILKRILKKQYSLTPLRFILSNQFS